MEGKMTLSELCEELGISIVPVTKQRKPMQTFAHETLDRILHEHGSDHLRSVLITIVETASSNKRQLVTPVIYAVSDILLAHPLWFSGELLDAMDAVDLGKMHELAKANRRAAQPRQAISTMLFERLHSRFDVKTKRN
jgi:hypothetical protein